MKYTKENNEIEFTALSRDEIMRHGGHLLRVSHYRLTDSGRVAGKTTLMNKRVAKGYMESLKHDGYKPESLIS